MMSETETPLLNIDRMARLVEITMGRATTPLPHTLIKQTSALLRYCLRRHLTGNPAHPGIAKMARMGKCSERQAQRNIRVLEAWGVVFAVSHAKGGRWAPRYCADIDQLKRTLIALGCNPSRQLINKMERVRGDIGGDIWRDKWRDTMSPGIQIRYKANNCWTH